MRNDKYLKAGSSRRAPRKSKCVKAESLRLREKSPHRRGGGPPPLPGLEKVPTRAGEGTRPYVAWKKSPPFREKCERMGHSPALRGPRRPAPRKSRNFPQTTALA